MGEWIGDVIEAANDVDTEASREVAALLEEVSLHLEDLNADAFMARRGDRGRG